MRSPFPGDSPVQVPAKIFSVGVAGAVGVGVLLVTMVVALAVALAVGVGGVGDFLRWRVTAPAATKKPTRPKAMATAGTRLGGRGGLPQYGQIFGADPSMFFPQCTQKAMGAGSGGRRRTLPAAPIDPTSTIKIFKSRQPHGHGARPRYKQVFVELLFLS